MNFRLPHGSKPRKSLKVGSDLWVADYGLNCIHIFNKSFQLVDTKFDPLIEAPRGLCKKNNHVFVTCYPKDSKGSIVLWNTREFSTLCACDRPRGIVCSGNYLFVCEVRLSHVTRLDLQSMRMKTLGSHKLLNPRGIDICRQDNLCVADSGNNRVVVMTVDGIFKQIITNICFPNDIVAYNGTMFVSDWLHRCVHVIADEKKTNFVFVSSQHIRPTMMSMFNGKLVVSDNSNSALCCFDVTRDITKMSEDKPCAIELKLSSDKILDMSCKKIDDVEIVRIAQKLVDDDFTYITNLQLWQNAIGDIGICYLASTSFLNMRLPNLKTLWLGHNKIGNAGVVCLAKALKNVPLLNDIYLDDNKIESDGLIMFCEYAPSNLRRLGLHTNQIKDLIRQICLTDKSTTVTLTLGALAAITAMVGPPT